MANEQQNMGGSDQQQAEQQSANESGLPGGGVGRREGPFNTPVYPVSADEGANENATVESEPSWGQGKRGAAGYEDSGGSGLEDFSQMVREAEQRSQQQEPQEPQEDQESGQQ
jgi:hypothetical protein